jgi:tRNA(fMet)-specific endonuclease VapC
MGPRYLLDTNIVIYIRERRPSQVLDRLLSLRAGDAVISVVTYGELRYGLEKRGLSEPRLDVLSKLVERLAVQPLPISAGAEYGVIRHTLQSRGEIIGNNDIWIAAHARAAGLILVTNNEREFRRVPGLNIENWASD